VKRVHVHVTVYDIDANVWFYSSLFGAAPAVLEEDYAEWIIDDPQVHFAISSRGATPRVDHFGIQVSSDHELAGVRQKLARLNGCVTDEPRACPGTVDVDCNWAIDPQGIVWEAFWVPVCEPAEEPTDAKSTAAVQA
jgi:catechol 2,3-dioxygenase-like lactoylglutathione lyase family enzyme